jgi:hypothetical protein
VTKSATEIMDEMVKPENQSLDEALNRIMALDPAKHTAEDRATLIAGLRAQRAQFLAAEDRRKLKKAGLEPTPETEEE